MLEELNYAKQIEQIFKMKKADVEREFSSCRDIEFYSYYKRFFDNPNELKEYHSELCNHILEVTKSRKKRLLDVGAGFGLNSIYFNILGAEVVGVEIDPEKKAIFEKLLKRLVPPLKKIEMRIGDALEIDFEAEQFDAIICCDVISHVKDLELFLLKMYKALAKGGFLFIRDNNNSLSLFQKKINREIWRKAECEYKSLRKKAIKRILKTNQEDLANLLAEKTAGLYGDEIAQAVNQYLRYGKTTLPVAFKCRDPISGIYLERDFNPFLLGKILRKFGFQTKMLRPFLLVNGRVPSIMFAAQAIKVFHPLSLFVSPIFEILCQKI